jgi:DNA-binding NtrC family response regulator
MAPEITLLDRKLVRPVLVVAASAGLRESLARQIRPSGLPICLATSVAEALELLQSATPLAAICEGALFDAKAGAVVREMRSQSPLTKLFFVVEAADHARLDGLEVDGLYDRAATADLIRELHRLAMA